MSDFINSAQVLNAMQTAVRLRGASFRYGTHYSDQAPECDYNSPGCAYEEDGRPACIIGWVWVILGLDVPETNGSIGEGHIHGGIFTVKALAAMVAAQRVQDNNGTWGQALDSARRTVAAHNEDGTPIAPPALDPSRMRLTESDIIALNADTLGGIAVTMDV